MTGWFACLPDQPAVVDGPSDADAGLCATGVAFPSAFEAPHRVFSMPLGVDRRGASLSHDELTIYFGNSTTSSGILYPSRIHTAIRPRRSELFVNSEEWDVNRLAGQDFPRFSDDGKTVVFAGITENGGYPHLFFSSNSGAPKPLALNLDGGQFELNPFLRMRTNGTGELYFAQCTNGSVDNCDSDSTDQGSRDLFRVSIRNPNLGSTDAFSDAEALTEINTRLENEYTPVVSSDGLEIFFGRSGKIFRAWRNPGERQFHDVEAAEGLLAVGRAPNWLSPDNCRLYFQSSETQTTPGIVDIWVAERKPPTN
ncbi:hypothetical protein LVJ94_08765 [Pendulispora rubella]|uniref:Uncharacterized protein n=1 Tax=Pendulispora rubella TaxID=2741070 RepID=A0ABZ2L8S1_9BACT